MNPDPPYTAAQIYLRRRVWITGLAVAVILVLALFGLGTLLFRFGGW
jgi:hypothetical protein